MRTVWKFEFNLADLTTLRMPKGARPIAAAMWGSHGINIWAEVETDNELVDHTIAVCGTGHEAPDRASHIATLFSGPFVWHVYDTGERSHDNG